MQAGGVGADRQRRRSLPPDIFSPEDEAALRAFLEGQGWAIQHHLNRAKTTGDDLRLAWAYRAVLEGETGAWDTWVRVIRRQA